MDEVKRELEHLKSQYKDWPMSRRPIFVAITYKEGNKIIKPDLIKHIYRHAYVYREVNVGPKVYVIAALSRKSFELIKKCKKYIFAQCIDEEYAQRVGCTQISTCTYRDKQAKAASEKCIEFCPINQEIIDKIITKSVSKPKAKTDMSQFREWLDSIIV